MQDDEEEFDDEAEPVRVGDQPVDERWYSKAAIFVNHCNEVAKRLCRHPAFCCSIDEMMKLFKGRSAQMHHMKQTPIKEGYKVFAICCAQSGFVFHFAPDGSGEKDEPLDDTVRELMATLPQRNNIQYVVGMDNDFMTRQVMIDSRSLGGGVIGTARARSGWPPQEIKNITDDRFKSLYLQTR